MADPVVPSARVCPGGIQPVCANNGRKLFFVEPETSEMKVGEFTGTTEFQRGTISSGWTQ